MITNPTELIDFGRSLFYGRHTAKIAKPPVSRAFKEASSPLARGWKGTTTPIRGGRLPTSIGSTVMSPRSK